jgi:hypothetical protein
MLFVSTQWLAAGTSDGRGFVGLGDDALPANIIVVTNTNDSGPGSLRDALAAAHDGDTIDATGVSGRILLTSGALQTNSFFNNNLLIIGPGAGNLAIDGNATFPVFKNSAMGVTISGFTITNGLSDSNGGGGIQNLGGGLGGGQQGELTVTSCSVVSNKGVGISNIANDENPPQNAFLTLTITNSTVSGNSGGGISNIAEAGETDEADAELTVSNCTISGNTASNGGGIYNAGGGPRLNGHANVAISNSTLSGNSADIGGAIYNGGGTFGGAGVTLGSTILNAGASGGTIFIAGGGINSLGYNLASDDGDGVLTGPGDQINTDPMLGPLQDNGGPTFTQALLRRSPAIDAGDPSFTPPPFVDQRGPGFRRVRHGRIDIGSFEVQRQH